MTRHRRGQPPSPQLVDRMAAVLRAIPPAFPPVAAEAAAVQPSPSAASPPDPRRRRHSLSNATHAAWQQELGTAQQRMQQLGVGRTRSEPGMAQRAAASPLPAPAPPLGRAASPLPPAPDGQPNQQPRPAAASPLPPAGRSPGHGRRLLRSMRRRGAQLSPAAACPRPPPVTPPSASRRQSGAGGPEASPRNTPFVVPAAALPPLSPHAMPAGAAPPPASPGRPSPQAASPLPEVQQPSPRSPSPAAADAASVVADGPPGAAAAAAAAACPAAVAAAIDAPLGSDPPLARLLSSLPRRLQADLLSLLRRQRDYVGARRQDRQRALRRLQKRLGRLEEQWQRLRASGGAAAGRHHALRLLQRLGAAPYRSRSEPYAGAAAAAEAAVPLLSLEGSEPTLGGEYLLEATLRPPSPASQRARQPGQQLAAGRPGTPSALPAACNGSSARGGSRVPSLRGGDWSPPPATPRLPLWRETSSPWGQLAGGWRQQVPQSPLADQPLDGGQLPGATTPSAAGCSPAAPTQQGSPAGGGSTSRPPTALERLKQSHLYSPLPSRRSSFTHGAAAGVLPADALVQVASPGVQQQQQPDACKAQAAAAAAATSTARPLTTPPKPAPLELELRGHAIGAATGAAAQGEAAGAGGGALGVLKLRLRAGRLAAAALRPTTAPS